jgi:hypothetical protein
MHLHMHVFMLYGLFFHKADVCGHGRLSLARYVCPCQAFACVLEQIYTYKPRRTHIFVDTDETQAWSQVTAWQALTYCVTYMCMFARCARAHTHTHTHTHTCIFIMLSIGLSSSTRFNWRFIMYANTESYYRCSASRPCTQSAIARVYHVTCSLHERRHTYTDAQGCTWMQIPT